MSFDSSVFAVCAFALAVGAVELFRKIRLARERREIINRVLYNEQPKEN